MIWMAPSCFVSATVYSRAYNRWIVAQLQLYLLKDGWGDNKKCKTATQLKPCSEQEQTGYVTKVSLLCNKDRL